MSSTVRSTNTPAPLPGNIEEDMVSRLRAPLFIGHRGSNVHFPEHSMEGYRAVARDGFLPEPDVHALADGTLVCIHDFSVERTMTGVTGKVRKLTRDQWLAGRIRPPHGTSRDARPVLFDQVLDEFGGRIVMVPEIKDYDARSVEAFIAAITDRHLERAVIAQSFDYDVAQRLANAGIATLFLIGDGRNLPTTFGSVRAAGIEYVGPSADAATEVITEANSAGLESLVWTVNSRREALAQFERGVFGIFSDDVWATSGKAMHQ